jgi:hypothetical protein
LFGVVGETLAAAFNPQSAAWSHAPAAAETEDRHDPGNGLVLEGGASTVYS